MNRERWVCVGGGAGATGAAIYGAQSNVVGAFAFGMLVFAALVAAHMCDIRKAPEQTEHDVGAKPQLPAAGPSDAPHTTQRSPLGGSLIGVPDVDQWSKALDDELATLLLRGRVVHRLMPGTSPAKRREELELLANMVESSDMVVFLIPSNGKA